MLHVALCSSYALPPAIRSTEAFECVDGVFVLAARGSDANFHSPNEVNPAYAELGGLQPVADAVIAAAGAGSFLKAVPYPATLNKYSTSLGHGIDAAQALLQQYIDSCCEARLHPRIVLLGYSQGANVMSDALVGGDGRQGMAELQEYSKHRLASRK